MTEEWIQKMLFIYTMEYYSAIKNKDFLGFAGKWMELGDSFFIWTLGGGHSLESD